MGPETALPLGSFTGLLLPEPPFPLTCPPSVPLSTSMSHLSCITVFLRVLALRGCISLSAVKWLQLTGLRKAAGDRCWRGLTDWWLSGYVESLRGDERRRGRSTRPLPVTDRPSSACLSYICPGSLLLFPLWLPPVAVWGTMYLMLSTTSFCHGLIPLHTLPVSLFFLSPSSSYQFFCSHVSIVIWLQQQPFVLFVFDPPLQRLHPLSFNGCSLRMGRRRRITCSPIVGTPPGQECGLVAQS